MRAKRVLSRRRRAAAVVLVMSSAAATLVLASEIKKGDYAPAELGTMRQRAGTEMSTDGNFGVTAYPAPAAELAAGDGLQDVRIYCSVCHSLRYITMQPPLPAASWEGEVNKMSKAFGATIPDESSRKIILYLQSHYSTENRKE